MKSCPKCNELLGDNADKCFNCHYDFKLKRVVSPKELVQRREKEEEKIRQANENVEKAKRFSENFMMTTGYNFDGYKITTYKGVISSECIMGTGALSEFSARFSDFIGTTATGYEDKLAKAKEEALDKLRSKALLMISNGLIGIDFDVSTIGDNMILVSANGTAVVVEKI